MSSKVFESFVWIFRTDKVIYCFLHAKAPIISSYLDSTPHIHFTSYGFTQNAVEY